MKCLIVYYSLTGNVKLLSEAMAEVLKADVLALKTKKEIKSNSFMKYFWGGKQVMTKELPALESIDIKPEDYELIILGTPVWAFTYAPAVRSFLAQTKLNNKKIALFCSHESNPGKTFINLQTDMPNNEVVATMDFFAPLKKDKDLSLEKAKAWAKNLISQEIGSSS